LQRCRHKRVSENVESFVQICARVLRSDACTETDPILRHGWIIHRRNPQTTPSQFMPKPIHALTIGDDDGHHVRCRFSGVEPQASKLRMEVIGILPKLHTQFRLAGAKLQRLENGRDHHWRQRTRVNIRMRVEPQVLQRLFRTGDEASQRAERLRESSIQQRDTVFDAKLLGCPATVFAARQHRVSFINKHARPVRLRHSN
jgi:hypothetical protein